MADKEKPKSGGGGGVFGGYDMIIMGVIAVISVLFVLWPMYGESIVTSLKTAFGGNLRTGVIRTIQIVQSILGFFGFLALIGLAYVTFKFARLRADYLKDMLDIMPEPSAPRVAEMRFQIIKDKALSQNPSERKVAIIEADAMLDEMIKKMGYSGETLADRLKNIETSDFLTLNAAWEAHKFRNRIAHEAHEVTLRDAKRVIALYEEVFQEFTYI
jgi:hypothetical protein